MVLGFSAPTFWLPNGARFYRFKELLRYCYTWLVYLLTLQIISYTQKLVTTVNTPFYFSSSRAATGSGLLKEKTQVGGCKEEGEHRRLDVRTLVQHMRSSDNIVLRAGFL